MIAHQGKFAEELDWWDDIPRPSDPWAAHGVHNHAIMVPGEALLAAATIDHDNNNSTPRIDNTPYIFVQQTGSDIEDQLAGWAGDVVGDWFVPATFTGFVILDIEHPTRPVKFRAWFNDDAEGPEDHYPVGMFAGLQDFDSDGDLILLDHIIAGFNRRIRAAREVFPVAKIAVYPMIHTSSDGCCSNSVEKNIRAWEYASTAVTGVPKFDDGVGVNQTFPRQSWLDNVDYVAVQLYPRFGNDPNPNCVDVMKYNEATTAAFVALAMETAKRIADMEAGVGVLPVSSFAIHNPEEENVLDEEGSCEDKQPATLEYMTWLMTALREYAFVGAPGYTIADMPICFWDGDGELASFPGVLRPPPEPQSIEEFMDLLDFALCDLDGIAFVFDGPTVLADEDCALWLHAVDDPNNQPANPFHMVFDTNGDRYITTTGAGNDLATFDAGPCGLPCAP